MNKIKKTLFLLTVAFTAVVAWSCDNTSNDDEENNSDNDNSTTYIIDFSTCSDFNKSSNTITISKEGLWSGIWLDSFDASEYEYLSFEYKSASDNFMIGVQYEDGFESDFCKLGTQSGYLRLDATKKSNIKQVFFSSVSGKGLNLPKENITTIPVELALEKSINLPGKVVDSKTTGSINTAISALEFAEKMKVGWNLGNSLDAWSDTHNNSSEYAWGEAYTTKEIVELGKNNGYTTIRIPVTWFNHIIDNEYTIDPRWMARVKEVVDWAIDAGYYVIINEHHSTNDKLKSPIGKCKGWMVTNNAADIAESKRFLEAVWNQITEAFNNSYDEHLIFETINEPRDEHHPECQVANCTYPYSDKKHHIWNALEYDASDCQVCLKDYEVLNEYNKLIVDTIRASGGNNAKRFIMVPAMGTGVRSPLMDQFKMPNDSVNDRLMLTVHDYIMNEDQYEAKLEFTEENKEDLINRFNKLNKKFIKNGIPVVIGETGSKQYRPLTVDANNKGITFEKVNTNERIEWITAISKIASSYGMPLIYWDSYDKDNEFGELDRYNLCIRSGETGVVSALLSNWDLNNEPFKIDLVVDTDIALKSTTVWYVWGDNLSYTVDGNVHILENSDDTMGGLNFIDKFSVNANEIYKLKADVKLEKGDLSLFFTTYDSAGNTINWSRGAKKAEVSSTYTTYESVITVADNEKMILPAIQSNTKTKVYIKNISVSKMKYE